MKIRKFYAGVILLILLVFLSNSSHLSVLAGQQAQLYANYILVENIEGMGFLEGEVIGMPSVDEEGVTGLLRVHNKTGWWVGLTVSEHYTKVKSVDIADMLPCPTAQLIPPNSYRDFSSQFNLEDDFVTFVFDNKNWATPANMWEAFIDGMPQSNAFSKDAVAKTIIDIVTLQCLEAPQLVKGDLKTAIKNEYMQKKIIEILKKNLSIELSDKTLVSAIGGFVKIWKVKDLLSRIRESGQVFVAYKLNHDTAPSVTFRGLRIGNRNISEQVKAPCVYYIPHDEKSVIDKIKGFIPFLKEVEKIQNYKEKPCSQSDSISRSQSLSVAAPLIEGWKTYRNQELGFEFQYSPELGEVNDIGEGSYRTHLFTFSSNKNWDRKNYIVVEVYTEQSVDEEEKRIEEAQKDPNFVPEPLFPLFPGVDIGLAKRLLGDKQSNYDCSKDLAPSDKIPPEFRPSCTIVNIGGIKVIKVIHRPPGPNADYLELSYFFLRNNAGVNFSMNSSVNVDYKSNQEEQNKKWNELNSMLRGNNPETNLKKDLDMFEKIVSTVKFDK